MNGYFGRIKLNFFMNFYMFYFYITGMLPEWNSVLLLPLHCQSVVGLNTIEELEPSHYIVFSRFSNLSCILYAGGHVT